MNNLEYLKEIERLEEKQFSNNKEKAINYYGDNQAGIAKALEIIAECMLKSNEMAKEALKKSNELHEANMAMMKESQIKCKVEYIPHKIKLEGLDGTGKQRRLPGVDPNLIQYDLTK